MPYELLLTASTTSVVSRGEQQDTSAQKLYTAQSNLL